MTMHRRREPQFPPTASLTVRFPKTDLEVMRRLAQRNHRSLNREVVHAIAEYIRRQGQPDTTEQNT